MDYKKIVHPLAPICFSDSRVLILGTMPSLKSRENGFYYSHPQNRFWQVISAVCAENVPSTSQEKVLFLKKNKIALWDVVKSCDICGASDATIKNVEVNDIKPLLSSTDIRAIFTTGRKAHELYCKYCERNVGIKAYALPSTSPANASMNKQRLISEYSLILDYISG